MGIIYSRRQMCLNQAIVRSQLAAYVTGDHSRLYWDYNEHAQVLVLSTMTSPPLYTTTICIYLFTLIYI